MRGMLDKDKGNCSVHLFRHEQLLILTVTYNSALDASPPKASKLPEVIFSIMDLLAAKRRDSKHQIQSELNT